MTPLEQYQLCQRDTGALALDTVSSRLMIGTMLAGSAGITAYNVGKNNGMALLGLAGVLISGFVLIKNPEKAQP